MSLLNTLNAVKSELNPLPQHYLVKRVDVYLREQYATLLAGIMLDNGSVSQYQNELFTLMLGALQLEAQPSHYLSASQQIDTAKIIELIKHLNKSGHINLLFDAILLLRIDTPLTPDQVKLLNTLIDVFEIAESDVLMTVFWANKALGIEADFDEKQQDKFYQLTELKVVRLFNATDFQLLCYPDSFVTAKNVIFKGTSTEKKTSSGSNSWGLSGLSLLNYSVVDFKSMHTGWMFDIVQKASENMKVSYVSYRVLPLPSALAQWTDLFAEIYPANTAH